MTHHPILETLLARRGIVREDAVLRFLSPDYQRDLDDPFLLPDMERAAQRILAALRAREPIVIYSDYDMDGIPGAVVLWDTLQALGAEALEHYTPHRTLDGFGVSVSAIEELAARGAQVIISVDCGSTDTAAALRARELGVDLIITDHHLLSHDDAGAESLPDAFAVINPKRERNRYAEPNLCGAGVAFTLARALLRLVADNPVLAPHIPEHMEAFEKWLLDMVGMATVADMVPLLGENRALAYFGLVVLRKSPRPGVRALLANARINQRTLTEDDIGFSIAPRINAASRMGHASDAFRLLVTRDDAEAKTLAAHLEKLNRERKGIVAAMVKEAHAKLSRCPALPSVIVLGNPLWRPSLAGLVANTLSETYARPAFVWGREAGTIIKGSCRAAGNVSVVAMMTHARETLLEYGGHRASGGFSVSDEHIFELQDALVRAHEAIAESKNDEPVSMAPKPDLTLLLGDVTEETYRALQPLAPFGVGNSKPLFLFEQVAPSEVRQFGKTREHLELSFLIPGRPRSLSAIAFFKTPDSFSVPMSPGRPISLLAHMERDSFRGSLRLRIVEVASPLT